MDHIDDLRPNSGGLPGANLLTTTFLHFPVPIGRPHSVNTDYFFIPFFPFPCLNTGASTLHLLGIPIG
jgi:hypothetical protein